MKRLENLKFTSLLGLLSVLYLGVLVASYYVYGPVAEHIEQVGKPADLFSTIPMLVFDILLSEVTYISRTKFAYSEGIHSIFRVFRRK